MTEPFRVALLGFSAFERSALASYFRLATQRQPSYRLVDDPAEARFILADADAPGVLAQALVLGRLADTVFVGGHSPPGAAAWMMRPIDPLHVLREFDALLAGAPAGHTGAQALDTGSGFGALAAAPEGLGTGLPGRRRRQGDAAGGPAPVPVAAEATAAPSAANAAGMARAEPAAAPGVLLVDDSAIALRFLEKSLQSWRLKAERAATSGRALEMLARQPFDIVFLDVELGERSELDGLALCRHIKQRHVHPGGRAPVVVLLSAHAEPVDRVRGELAGCDEYLGKPLDAQALGEVLRRHGVQPTAA